MKLENERLKRKIKLLNMYIKEKELKNKINNNFNNIIRKWCRFNNRLKNYFLDNKFFNFQFFFQIIKSYDRKYNFLIISSINLITNNKFRVFQ